MLQRRRRRRGPAGQRCVLRCKSSPIVSTERGLPVAGHRYSAGPAHGKLNLHPSLQRGARYAHVSLLTCLLCMLVIVESEGNGTGRWEALPGKPEGPQPSEKVGRAWEQCSEGGWDVRQEHGQEATGKPPTRRERGEARPFLQFGFCFDPCCSEARRHPPTMGMSGSPGSGQAKVGARPQTRLAREPRDRGYR